MYVPQSALLEFTIAELQRCTDVFARPKERIYMEKNLEYVTAMVTLLNNMMFNSDAVENRAEVLTPRCAP